MVPDGWMWLIPLAGARLSVGVVSRDAITSPERRWTRADRRVAAHPAPDRRRGRAPSRASSATSATATGAPTAPRWGCAGDASCFLDPVFSSGVSLAMLGAESVADRLSAALREGREADPELLADHARRMEIGYRSFAGLIYRFYHADLVHQAVLPGHRRRAAARRHHQRARRRPLARRQPLPADAAALADRPRPGRSRSSKVAQRTSTVVALIDSGMPTAIRARPMIR